MTSKITSNAFPAGVSDKKMILHSLLPERPGGRLCSSAGEFGGMLGGGSHGGGTYHEDSG